MENKLSRSVPRNGDELKHLPANPQAERLVLANVLHNAPQHLKSVRAELSPADFTLQRHQLIYARIIDLDDRGEAIDRATLTEELRRRGELRRVTLAYLAQIEDDAPDFQNVGNYTGAIRRTADRRRFIEMTGGLHRRAWDESSDLDVLRAEGALLFNGAGPYNGAISAARVDIDTIPSVQSYTAGNIEFAVDGLIACGCLTMLSGESGCGKSTLMTAMAGAIVRGDEFAGRQCIRRKALILDRENGIEVVRERFQRLGITDGGPTVWGGWLEQEAPEPDDRVILDWVARTVPKPFIGIDTAVTFLNGEENNATDVKRFMNSLRRCAHLGAAIVVLHHSGKAETAKDYRGSSYFKGGSDVAFQMVNFGSGELTKVKLTAFKSRFTVDRDVVFDYADGKFHSDVRPHAAIAGDSPVDETDFRFDSRL
jgi:hypothetical protein